MKASRFLCLVIMLFSFSPLFSSNEIEINFITDPAPENIGPDEDLVNVKISLTQNGKPVNGNVSIVLDSPKRNSIISTDFPVVEGTRLIETSGITKNGLLEMDYLFPIRGNYNLSITAAPLIKKSFPPAKKNFQFTIFENPNEVSNMYILWGILVLFGLISGIILGNSAVRSYQ